MRLLNVHTLQFQEFYGIPENYIVTSHRWSAGNEAMLEDIKNERRMDTSGFKKVQGFAKFVRENFPHVNWLWIDTCCVNQESDREVSEAVNSMFRWYSQAELCLAYFADVTDLQDMYQFGRSEWFRRGWTSQELLAPQAVLFLSQHWEVIGRKGSETTKTGIQLNSILPITLTISGITNIPSEVLRNYARSKDYSIEARLAWMTGRETTREEDMVYSLFGIFDVTLPVIYGETAKRATRRLLKEIAEVSAIRTPSDFPREYSEPHSMTDSASEASSTNPSSRDESQDRADMMGTTSTNNSDVEDNEDDVLISDFVEAAFANGNDAFEHQDYYTAESQYEEAVELISKLSNGAKQFHCNYLSIIQRRLAICAFHIDDPVVVEGALSVVVEGAKCQTLEQCWAGHLLSQVLIRKGNLEQAAAHCKGTYLARRRLLGKDSTECYESLALLSRIHRLTGNEREAIRYLGVIPQDMQNSMWERFSRLWPPVQLRWSGFKMITSNRPFSVGQHRCLEFSHDSRLFACIKENAAVGLWDVTSGAELMQLDTIRDSIRDIAI